MYLLYRKELYHSFYKIFECGEYFTIPLFKADT